MRVAVPRDVLAALRAHADRAAPDEACGALVGHFMDHGVGDPLFRDREVVRAMPMRNAHPRPRGAYLLDAGELVAVAAEAEAAGLDVVGFYHSHPRGPPGPSAEDVARATWAGATYLVLWSEPAPAHGAWRWDEAGRRFVDEAIDTA